AGGEALGADKNGTISMLNDTDRRKECSCKMSTHNNHVLCLESINSDKPPQPIIKGLYSQRN
ncbi:MAG: hypothetical protein J1E43_12290, partial [Christensenellaceae bacterium]|nr:hypothetical protein [Christensenellaceae bacterium]